MEVISHPVVVDVVEWNEEVVEVKIEEEAPEVVEVPSERDVWSELSLSFPEPPKQPDTKIMKTKAIAMSLLLTLSPAETLARPKKCCGQTFI
ncbi:MAG: hypothetical protein J7K48_09900 [Thermococcus sp.]|nr:hypothetical protein [Thermococcus sp.]